MNMLNLIWRSARKGVSNVIIGSLLLIPLLLIISVAVFYQFTANVDRTGWTSTANATFDKIVGQTTAGYNLATLLPFVFIAIAVIGVLIGLKMK